MNYFFDTEFYEHENQIDLISIGVVAEDGREFYAVSDVDPWATNEWLRDNVFSRLQPRADRLFKKQKPADIRADLLSFIGDDDDVRFMAYYGAYDWVVLCQLMGGMMSLPKSWYWICSELRTELDRLGGHALSDQGRDDEHNALADARWVARTARLWKIVMPAAKEADRG